MTIATIATIALVVATIALVVATIALVVAIIYVYDRYGMIVIISRPTPHSPIHPHDH